MKIKLVVFDIAGTTVKDSGEIAIAFQSALSDFGYQVPVQKINPMMGYKKPEAIRMILSEFEKDETLITEAYVERIHLAFQKIMIEYYTYSDELQALPFAEEIFEYLKSHNVKIGLDTGFSKAITEVIINRLGWMKDKKIDSYVCSDEVEKGRPYPFMIEKIMQQLELTDPKSVIKVGDTEVDINEGKAAGCFYNIGITTGAYSEEELRLHEPSFIINNLQELIPIIEPLL